MRNVAQILFVSILAIIACAGCNQSTRPTKWEYLTVTKQVKMGFPFSKEEMNKNGQDGWELVSVASFRDGSVPPVDTVTVTYKKPTP